MTTLKTAAKETVEGDSVPLCWLPPTEHFYYITVFKTPRVDPVHVTFYESRMTIILEFPVRSD